MPVRPLHKRTFSPSGANTNLLETDVLVIGGGPAGTWAACNAASGGARVILVDKGYCGSSGATAPSGTGVWYVDPDGQKRAAAKASRETLGGFLADHHWMDRVLERTYDSINILADWGYPFPKDDQGRQRRNSLQGPEYMRLMRRRVKEAGARILDHSPALELLVDEQGQVAGAAGIHRQKGESWTIRANAVVLASGGCAFLSKALGCNVLTGDGYLMAAEAGAELSGMEFSNAYGIAPAFASVTKTLFYDWASFTDAEGAVIPGASSKGGRSVIARALQQGPVFAQLDRADGETQAVMRKSQPNFFLPFDRAGIDPFRQRFPVTLRLEGTVRGTGGLRIVDDSCATTVPGLYAAGDAATRELICGGFTGGGSHNAAWAMSSGYWAGTAAAAFARSERGSTRKIFHAGGAGFAEAGIVTVSSDTVVKAVQDEVLPFGRNYFRAADRLEDSLVRLDKLWTTIGQTQASRQDILRAREAASMTATARWMYRSALARTESRGMARREDFPQQKPDQRRYVITGGVDDVWVSSEPAPQLVEQGAAA